jgi:O-antigen ligase
MVSERPVLGWGPVEYRDELKKRVAGYGGMRDAHNLPLNLLLEVGFLGAGAFLVGVGFCLLGAWKVRDEALGILPFALLVMLLVFLQFQPWMTSKPFWLVLALCAGAAKGVESSRSKWSRKGSARSYRVGRET